MFRGDFMPCTNNAALEQRESRFHGIGVNVAVRIFTGMVDGLVEVLLHFVECPRINSGFIGHNDFHMTADVRVDNLAHGLRLSILRANEPQIAIALPNADNYGLVAFRTPSAS